MTHQAFLQSLSPADRARLTALTNGAGLMHLGLHAGAIVLLATAIALGVPGWPFLLLPLGIFQVFLFHLLHEVTHETVFASKPLNIWVARIAGFILLIPPLWFRYFHFAHHKHTHDPQHDPELATPKPRTWPGYLWYLTGLPMWGSLLKTLWNNGAGKCVDAYVPTSALTRIAKEARLMLQIYAVILAFSLLLGSALLFWIWVLPLVLGQPFLRLYLMAEHTDCAHVPDMFTNTRTTFTTRAIRWLAWNMPYHAEHHALPSVPFHQLPALHDLAQSHLRETAPGYAAFHATYAARLTPAPGSKG